MVVHIQRTEQKFQFKAENETTSLPLIGNPLLSETTDGFRPMELVLLGLGGCMSIDVLNILYKQKQIIKAYGVSISGERNPEPPSAFHAIALHFTFKGDLDENRVEKAIRLAEEKYCSVYHSLNPVIDTKFTFEIQA
jgi:putative redox protein